jgi:hypothetical protein
METNKKKSEENTIINLHTHARRPNRNKTMSSQQALHTFALKQNSLSKILSII